MYFVNALTTMLASTERGWNKYGEVIVLSTTYTSPFVLQSSPIASRSATWVRGFAMVSTNTGRVFGRNADSTAATDVASTNVTSMPWLAKLANRLFVLPNKNALETK